MDKAGAIRFLQWPSGMRWWILILMGAAGLRFYHRDWAALWYDEAFSLVMSQHSPRVLFEVSRTDVHPPLYYLMLKGWVRLFGDGLDSLRALSAFAGVVTVGLGMWLTALIANRRAGLLAGVMLTLLPFAVRYSQEVRMYALLGLWMTGATIALVYWVKQPHRYHYLCVYVVFVAAGFYTHYFAFTVIAAHWLYLMIVRVPVGGGSCRLALRTSWWIANLAVALMFVPWLPTFLRQAGNPNDVAWIPPVSSYSIPSLFWQYLTLGNAVELPAMLFWGLVIVLLALSVYCIVSDDRFPRLSGLLAICFWAPILMTFIVSFHRPVFMPRYLIFSALSLPIIVAVAVERLSYDHRWIAGVIFALVVGLELTGLRHLYDPQSHEPDLMRHNNEQIDAISHFINAQARLDDQVIALNYFWYPSLVYYLKTARPLLYAPASVAGDDDCPLHRYCRFKAPYESGRDDLYISNLEDLPADIHRVWLVDGVDTPRLGLDFPCDWQPLSTWVRGDNRLRLYEVNAGQPVSKPCPAP